MESGRLELKASPGRSFNQGQGGGFSWCLVPPRKVVLKKSSSKKTWLCALEFSIHATGAHDDVQCHRDTTLPGKPLVIFNVHAMAGIHHNLVAIGFYDVVSNSTSSCSIDKLHNFWSLLVKEEISQSVIVQLGKAVEYFLFASSSPILDSKHLESPFLFPATEVQVCYSGSNVFPSYLVNS